MKGFVEKTKLLQHSLVKLNSSEVTDWIPLLNHLLNYSWIRFIATNYEPLLDKIVYQDNIALHCHHKLVYLIIWDQYSIKSVFIWIPPPPKHTHAQTQNFYNQYYSSLLKRWISCLLNWNWYTDEISKK